MTPAEVELTPTTKVSLPIKMIIGGTVSILLTAGGVGLWFWEISSLINTVAATLEKSIDANAEGVKEVVHSLEDLSGDVVDLRVEVSKLSTDDVRRHEILQWIDLMRARHPDIEWADFPHMPR